MTAIITAGGLHESRTAQPLRLPLPEADWQNEDNLTALANKLGGTSIPSNSSVDDWNDAIAGSPNPTPPPGSYDDYLNECGETLQAAFNALPQRKWLTVADARKSLREYLIPHAFFDLLPMLECRWKVYSDGRHIYYQTWGRASLSELDPDAELLSIRTTNKTSAGGSGRQFLDFLREPNHLIRGKQRIAEPEGVDAEWNGEWVVSKETGVRLSVIGWAHDESEVPKEIPDSAHLAAEWIRDPRKCAAALDEVYHRFLDCYPRQAPVGDPSSKQDICELPPLEDLQLFKAECSQLRDGYRLAQQKQPKLTVPMNVVNQFFDEIREKNVAGVRLLFPEFGGYVAELKKQLRGSEPDLLPAEFVKWLAEDIEAAEPDDDLPLPVGKTGDDATRQGRERYQRDFPKLAGKPLRELPQPVLNFAIGLCEKVSVPTNDIEAQSLRFVIARCIQQREVMEPIVAEGGKFENDQSSSTVSSSLATTDVWGKLKRALIVIHYDTDGKFSEDGAILKEIADIAEVKPSALQYQFKSKLFPEDKDATATDRYERALSGGYLKKILDAERDSGRVFGARLKHEPEATDSGIQTPESE